MWLFRRIILSWIAQKNDRKNDTESINRSGLRLRSRPIKPINWSNQQLTNRSTHRPTKVVHDCPADPINNCLVKPKTIKNGYAKEPMGKTIYTSEQPRTIDRPSDRDQATHPRAVGLQQSEGPIWERLDCNQLIRQLTKQLVKYEHEYKYPLEVEV